MKLPPLPPLAIKESDEQHKERLAHEESVISSARDIREGRQAFQAGKRASNVSTCICSLPFLNSMASSDAASNICQPPHHPTRLGPSFLGLHGIL